MGADEPEPAGAQLAEASLDLLGIVLDGHGLLVGVIRDGQASAEVERGDPPRGRKGREPGIGLVGEVEHAPDALEQHGQRAPLRADVEV